MWCCPRLQMAVRLANCRGSRWKSSRVMASGREGAVHSRSERVVMPTSSLAVRRCLDSAGLASMKKWPGPLGDTTGRGVVLLASELCQVVELLHVLAEARL